LGGGRGGPEVSSASPHLPKIFLAPVEYSLEARLQTIIKRSSGGINFTQANTGFMLGRRRDFCFFLNNTKALQKNKPIKNKMTNKR
jgi:hypothetical protein